MRVAAAGLSGAQYPAEGLELRLADELGQRLPVGAACQIAHADALAVILVGEFEDHVRAGHVRYGGGQVGKQFA
jgi:hypothetical protein